MPSTESSLESTPTPQERDVRILVVDDEEDILETLQSMFETYLDGVNVTTAASGQEALEALEQQFPDMILTDYRMPGMNGLEFLAQARERGYRSPAIMMTAFPEVDLAVQAINKGHVEFFLPKPLKGADLISTVNSVLAERRAEAMRARAFSRSIDLLRRQVREPPGDQGEA